MSERYCLRHDDYTEPVGTLTVDFDKDVFEIEENSKYDGELPFFLLYPKSSMSLSEKIKLWITERAPESNYTFIDALIERAGLTEYDAYGFFKYNNGRFITDDFYVEPIH